MKRLMCVMAVLLLAAGCGSETTDDGTNNGAANNGANNGKGDTPDVDGVEACELRNDDVINSTGQRFTRDFVRWPCGDVEGVNTENRDSRGQEYCEYFTVVRPPNEDGTRLVRDGEIFGIPSETSVGVDLNDNQLFYLEDHRDEVVGHCVFTSWHRDITEPLPCASEGCPDVDGVEVDDTFKMRISFNSNGAASDLVQRCYTRTENEDYGAENNFSNEFMRGCMMVADIFGTEWRSSDPQICAASMRLNECGCRVKGDPDADLGFALVPTPEMQREASGGITLRGFPLGTWSDPEGLPVGCEYVDVGNEADGEPGQNFVQCEITGGDLLQHNSDPKEFCRQAYGDNVVVHVPVPADALECEPPAEGPFSHTCSSEPWIINPTDDVETREECCRVCTEGKACGNTCIAADSECSAEPGCACDG